MMAARAGQTVGGRAERAAIDHGRALVGAGGWDIAADEHAGTRVLRDLVAARGEAKFRLPCLPPKSSAMCQ